jgi:site-specific recombinase XerD
MKLSLHHILVKNSPNSRGLFPIYLRIIIDRKIAHLSSGEFVSVRQWSVKDEQVKNHPLENDINARLRDAKSKVSSKFNERVLSGKHITSKELKTVFSGGRDMNNLFDFTESFIKEVQHKRSASTLENYRKHLLRLELYNGGKSLFFEDIDQDWLAKYETTLRDENIGKDQDRKLSNNYVHALFKTLKVIFNAAIKKGIITDYPFDRYENPVYVAPVKDYLTLEEIAKIEKFADETTDPVLKQTAVYFLLGISTGLRISDWFTFDIKENIKDGKVFLRAKKNGEWVTMPVNAILKRNLTRMAKLPLSIEEPTINEKLKIIAKKNKISKHLTSHSGRHSFAITLCADRGISSETCAELMGITINTCVENYYRISNRKIDSETVRAWEGL